MAASNLNQRTRMSMLYYHAELNNYAVIGTSNKNEHDQGFLVKHAPCHQQEVLFRLPFATMDLLWYAQAQNIPVAEVARTMELSHEEVQRAFADLSRKQRTTQYIRTAPVILA